MRVLLAAGGTGGHLRPAVATAEALRRARADVEVVFLTAGRAAGERFFDDGESRREPLFPERAGYPAKTDLRAWNAAFGRARHVIRSFKPDVIAGFGSYPTALAGAAGLGSAGGAITRLLAKRPGGPPLVLLDQNAVAGKAVRVLAPVARKILLSFEAARAGLDDRRAEILVTGNPLPHDFTHGPDVPPDPARHGLAPGRLTIVCLGGSQGARAVNEMVLQARGALAARCPGVQVLLLTGEGEHATVRSRLDATSSDPSLAPVTALPFTTRMKEVYSLADIVVARAGGTTLAELAIIGRPLVLIPYPHSKDRHQFANASAFEEVGAARTVQQGEGAADRLVSAMAGWLDDESARAAAGAGARELGHPDAAERCAREILSAAEAGQ